jgi:hypothetical protein
MILKIVIAAVVIIIAIGISLMVYSIKNAPLIEDDDL